MEHDPKSENRAAGPSWTRFVLIACIVVLVGLSAYGLPKFWHALMCGPIPPPTSAGDTDWTQPGIEHRKGSPREVYDELIAELEAQGYTICYDLKPHDRENPAEFCTGDCGARTSFRKGIIVADMYGLTGARIVRTKRTFKASGPDTLVFRSFASRYLGDVDLIPR